MTLIGVPRETAAGERRVALVPKVVERLLRAGLAVVVETGAGTGALIPDEHYEQAGATIGDPWPADLVVKVNPPTVDEIGLLKPGSTSIGFLAPRTRPEVADRLRLAGVTGFAMEAVPRISRAQTMDALSSQANVAGYKAVLVRAPELDPLLPDADHGGRHGETGHGAGARRRALPGCRRWPPPNGWAPGPPATTCVPRWPSRCARSAPSGWTSVSTRPVTAVTPASSPTEERAEQQQRWRRRSPGSTW